MKACNKLPPSEGAFNATYRVYVDRAKKQNKEFTLSKNDFRFLTQQNCFYCGAKPSNNYGCKYNNGRYIYNGLDRTDNKAGYTFTNCVPCCKICNVSKNKLDYVEFLQHIARIYERQKPWIEKSYKLKPKKENL